MRVIVLSFFVALAGVGQSPLFAEGRPTWVATLEKSSVSWDRGTVSWNVLSAFGSGFGPPPAPVSVILESRKEGEDEWNVLGTFPLAPGNYTNQTPPTVPLPVLLPERILAPPPNTSTGSMAINGSGPFTIAGRYTHYYLAPDNIYEYRMKATNVHGDAPYSEILVSRTAPLPPPHQPYDLFVKNLEGTSLEVLWTRSNLATEFIVERAQGTGDWQEVAVIDGTLHRWQDDLLTYGQTYAYRVRGRNTAGTSGPSRVYNAIARRLRNVFDDTVGIVLSTAWQGSSGVSVGPAPEDATANAIWFSGAASRSLTTQTVSFLIGGFLEFDFWTNDSFGYGSDILVQATINGGTWTTLGRIDPKEYRGRRRSLSIELPPSWSSPGLQFRFLQTAHAGEGTETWAIDDICILALLGSETAAPRIEIHFPERFAIVLNRRQIQIQGIASDNRKLLRWAYSLNNGPWKTGSLRPQRLATWSAKIPRLERGRNIIKVRTYDADGNVSSTKTRVVRVR